MSTPLMTRDLLDEQLPRYDVSVTEHVVVEAPVASVYRAVRELDFLRVRSPLLVAAMAVRVLPDRIHGRAPVTPEHLPLTSEEPGLQGWVHLGADPGRAVVFGAVGTFWSPQITWRDVPPADFRDFAEAGWGKIACEIAVRAEGTHRSHVTYECRTGTTDDVSRRQMARYWWLVRPFVGHVLRATLAQVRDDAEVLAHGLAGRHR